LFYNRRMNLDIASIGSIAWAVWQRDQSARVMGVTSRGLFLSIDQRILFVSFEHWRGPLTITLGRSIDQLGALDIGAAAVFSHNRLIFPATEIILSASSAAVWQAPLPVSAPCPIDRQRDNARQVAHIITSCALNRGFAPLLNPLLDHSFSSPLSTEPAAVLSVLRNLRQAMCTHATPAMQDSIDQLLGRGSGLTPSGDDCVLGLLLMLNRWQADRDWRNLNRAVIAAAYQKTTTISANLIECAVEGLADERLLNMVDGIVTGIPAVDECVECVLSWGSSSGIDALAGMAIAL
jgi:hypothetical protein